MAESAHNEQVNEADQENVLSNGKQKVCRDLSKEFNENSNNNTTVMSSSASKGSTSNNGESDSLIHNGITEKQCGKSEKLKATRSR